MSSQPETSSQRFLSSAQFHVLLAGLLTGAAAAVFPACGNIFTDSRTFAFSSTQYGSLFVVQTLLAILSSLSSPRIIKVMSERSLLRAGLVCGGVAMLMLAVSSLIVPGGIGREYCHIAASTFMGVGIGLSISVANLLSVSAWAARPQRGVAALHAMLGLGLALSPFGVSAGLAVGKWWLAPIAIVLSIIWLVSKLQVASGATHSNIDQDNLADHRGIPRVVIVLGVLAYLYGVAEATFSNWCVIYLHDRTTVGIGAAGLVLSGFWAAVTLGRLSYTAVSRRAGELIALVSPLVMAMAFLLISFGDRSWMQVIGFILAGAGCASVYPALLVRATSIQTTRRQLVSGLMVATVLAGTGTGTYLTAAIMEYFSLGLDEIYRFAAIIPLVIFAAAFLQKSGPDLAGVPSATRCKTRASKSQSGLGDHDGPQSA